MHGFRRLGETSGSVFTYRGFETIDASTATQVNRAYGHFYLMDNAAVLKDVRTIIEQKDSAKQRGLFSEWDRCPTSSGGSNSAAWNQSGDIAPWTIIAFASDRPMCPARATLGSATRWRGQELSGVSRDTRQTETTSVQVGPLAFKRREEAERQLTVIYKEKRINVGPDRDIEEKRRRYHRRFFHSRERRSYNVWSLL